MASPSVALSPTPPRPAEDDVKPGANAVPAAAGDTGLKRSYLELLPPAQVVDLCLALDAHVAAAARATVWPEDLPKAIAHLITQSLLTAASPTPGDQPVVAAPAARAPSLASLAANAAAGPSNAPSAPPPVPHHPSFGHYPAPVGGASAERLAQKRNLDPSHPNANLTPDELPSYEEMIVEALEALANPDGAPPKDLFQWMEGQYPLHSNFRPSASQALQKAFKRGRLTKSDTGRYMINLSWEGGSSSKRTRRPHVQPTPPYTKPLVQPRATPHVQPYGAVTPAAAFAYQSLPWNTAAATAVASPLTTAQPTVETDPNIAPETWRVLQTLIAEAQKAQAAPAPKVPPLSRPEVSPAPRVPLAHPVLPAAAPAAPSASAPASPADASSGVVISDRDREALQAQLSLLMAQAEDIENMSEDDDDDGDDDDDDMQEAHPPWQAPAAPSYALSAPTWPTVATSADPLSPAPLPLREEDDDDDDDMEAVDVSHAIFV